MKQTYTFIATAVLSLMAFGSQAQEVKEVKKEIRKEVNLQEENGQKTLTITTTENGKVTEEVYKEFIFQGNTYDIVSAKTLNGKHVLTCYNDTNEKSIKNQYKKLAHENGNSDKSSKGVLLKKALTDVYCEEQFSPFEKITISAVNDAHKALFYQLVSVETGFPSKETPPPKQTV